jgi:hypothetical protein
VSNKAIDQSEDMFAVDDSFAIHTKIKYKAIDQSEDMFAFSDNSSNTECRFSSNNPNKTSSQELIANDMLHC